MANLNVSRIQRFSTGDGPGIRTTVFLKGCNLRCPWCHNPENVVSEPSVLFFKEAGKTVTYGLIMSPEEVAKDVAEDADFYRASGGGVTVSGGEPMLQPDGVAELARLLRKEGIETLIDTAGNVPWSAFEAVLPCVGDYYYDIKTPSPSLYKETVGGDMSLVENNLRKLVMAGANVTLRFPLIPGFNDSEKDLVKIGEIALSAGVRHLDVLPFHRLGVAKYEAMGLDYKYKDILPPKTEHVKRAAEIIGAYTDVGIE